MGRATQSQEHDEGDPNDNSKRWKMSEKFAYWQKKGILQLGSAKTLEEAQHQLYVFTLRHYSIP